MRVEILVLRNVSPEIMICLKFILDQVFSVSYECLICGPSVHVRHSGPSIDSKKYIYILID